MSHSAYPTSTELSSYLVGTGLVSSTVAATLSLTDKAAAASSGWEEATGWHPFIKDSSDVARRFDPPGPNRGHGIWWPRGGKWVLTLPAGLLTVTSIVTGYSASSTNPQAGTAQVVEDDYWLLPDDAPLKNRPYTQVEFATCQWGEARSIRITGKWGYCETIPEDAWQAILQYGALLAAPDLAGQLTGGLLEWTEEAHERYAEKPLAHWIDQWQKTFDRAVARYQRIVL
jgi:hypothetical protein